MVIPQKKINIELPFDPAIAFLGVYSRSWCKVLKRYLYTCVHSGMIHNGPRGETAQESIKG